jgi:hypothetical protein
MTLDPYAPCRCGSGKKLKFCCVDLKTDLEKIEKLVEGEQFQAALHHVETLLAKQPTRTSLLTLQIELLAYSEQFEQLTEPVAQLLAAAPHSPIGYAYAAMLAAREGDALGGVQRLQDAMERLDGVLHPALPQAYLVVAAALLEQGDVVAAQAHLDVACSMEATPTGPAGQFLLRLYADAQPPLLLREQLPLAEPPDDAACRGACEAAAEQVLAARWRRAYDLLAPLLDAEPPEPAVVRNAALLAGRLGHRTEFAAGLARYARMDVPLEEAALAEAVSQLTSLDLQEPLVETVRIAFATPDADELYARLIADRRIEDYPLGTDEGDEAARPRHTLLLRDRALPEPSDALTIDDAPRVLAFLSIYGKRTDRDAQLTVTTDVDADFERTLSLLREIVGDGMGAEVERETLDAKPQSEHALTWRWRLPDGVAPAVRRRLLEAMRRKVVLERWTQAPRASLEGLSPHAAKGRPELRVPLLAGVVLLEQSASVPQEAELFRELRAALGLPMPPAAKSFDRLRLGCVLHQNLAAASNEELESLLGRSFLIMAETPNLQVSEELVRRDVRPQVVETCYRSLIQRQPDFEAALEWLGRARAWAADQGHALGPWALLELQLQLERGSEQGLRACLEEISRRHGDDREVLAGVYRLMSAAGLIPPLEEAYAQRVGKATARQPQPSAAPSRLWTPDGDSTPPDAPKSALWTP